MTVSFPGGEASSHPCFTGLKMYDTGFGFMLPDFHPLTELCALREYMRINPYLDVREVREDQGNAEGRGGEGRGGRRGERQEAEIYGEGSTKGGDTGGARLARRPGEGSGEEKETERVRRRETVEASNETGARRVAQVRR